MSLFKIDKQNLNPISEKKFDLEKDIQSLTEKNLEIIFGLKFISGSLNKEFSVRVNEQDFYIDTVALDESTNSIVLIEYKKDRSFSVIDQGFAYLAAMLNNKAEFILEINARLGKNFTKKDIDWEQSRIIFISNEFTNYQKNAINFKDLPMFLYEVAIYDNNIIDYNPIKPFKTSESINKFIKDKKVQEVAREIKVFTIDDHLKKANSEIQDLFDKIGTKVLELDKRIQMKPVTQYIGFRIRYHNFCTMALYKERIRVYVRAMHIDDPQKIFKKVPSKYGWGKTSLWYFDIKDSNKIDYVVSIIKQGYDLAPDK